MKKTLTQHDFIHEFLTSSRIDQFTVPALRAIYDYLEEVVDPNSELDVMAVCIEFTELTPEEIESEHAEACEKGCDLESILSYLREHTIVIPVDNGNYIIQQF